ncbi:MAG: hypothetical protein AAB250_02605, partial [Bdellovibrionota bacterium]
MTKLAGKVVVDFSGIKARIAEAYKLGGNQPSRLTTSLFVNGVETMGGFNWWINKVEFVEKPNRQTDYYVVHKIGSKIVDISDFHLHEGPSQDVAPASFAGRFPGEHFKLEFSDSMKNAGLSEVLTQSAVRLGYKKIVWVLSPEAAA